MRTLVAGLALAAGGVLGCSDDSGTGPGDGAVDGTVDVRPGPSAGCGSVRLTSYTASSGGWCEYDRTHAFLPAFVREGLTLAVAEPYNGSSYGGASGEACGECWEIDTITDTRTVMVHDLCPIEGNPLCAGAHFHFDLSGEAGAALHAGGLDEAQARRVPCPVEGNVHIQLNDRNEWGYVRLQFVNHRIPIRSADYRAADGVEWRPVQRSGGAWHVLEDNTTFAAAGPGGVFRLTSAQGEVLETPNVLEYAVGAGATFDLGAQLTDLEPPEGGACVFEPPATVYADGYGGIDEVRWQMNPWGEASASETTEGCWGGGGSCIRLDRFAQWSGFHIYYRQPFPTGTFATLALRLRVPSGSATLNVAPGLEGERCDETVVTVGTEWTETTIDLAASCTALATLNEVTADNPGPTTTVLIDDVRFDH
jgi:hypothetical protein